MRRKDREVKDYPEIIKIIDACDCCRLGFVDDKEGYIVPLNFGYETNGSDLTLYFHSAKEGRKIEMLLRQEKFELFSNEEILERFEDFEN